MKIHLGTEKIAEIKNAVVTSGTFDGVHLGHQQILDRLKQLAHEIDGETVLITYWPHPRLVLKPWDNSLQLLSTFPEKSKSFGEIWSRSFDQNSIYTRIRIDVT